jgi:hypothetical protein
MEPGCWDGIDLERFERDGAKHLVEVGRKQRIEDVTQPVIMERGPREPRLQQRHQPARFQPLPHLVQGMIAVQNRQDQGFDPTPSREHMRRVRWDEVINKGCDLQAS